MSINDELYASACHMGELDKVPHDGYSAQLHPPGMVVRGEPFILLRAHEGKPLTDDETALIRSRPDCVVVTSGDEWELVTLDELIGDDE